MELRPAGDQAELGRYVGYWEPYATSHQALDRDKALQDEVRNAALALAGALRLDRKGKLTQPQRRPAPRQK
jgi:hypothetical protein